MDVALQKAAEACLPAVVAALGRKDIASLRKALEKPPALQKRLFRMMLKNLGACRWPDAVIAALQMGIDAASTDADGRTLLHHLSEQGDLSTLDAILVLDSEISRLVCVRSASGRTPLHEATYNGHLGVMRRLLQCKAPIDERDTNGATPLILAVELQRGEAAELLVEHGATLSAKRNDGKSVLALAESTLGEKLKKVVAERSLEASLIRANEAWQSQNLPLRASIHSALGGEDVSLYEFAQADTGRAAQVHIDRIRTGDWNVFDDTYFDSTGAPDPAVYKGLAFAEAATVRTSALQACTAADVEEQIGICEKEIASATTPGAKCRINPLYFLLHARLAQLFSNEDQRVFLLRIFRQLAPNLATAVEAGGWLYPDEIGAMKDAEMRSEMAVMRSGSSAQEPPEPELRPASPADAARAQWESFKEQLSKKQREPMEKLLAMTGLENVKQIALEVYRGVLADERLVREGAPNAVGQRTLNYAFLGNPGTGKSTVGKLFAQLLAAAGARAGHKFIEMKASEAIRMGPKAFANELASLTGGKKGVAPPATELRRGMTVEVKMSTSAAGTAVPAAEDVEGCWFPATVLVCHDTGFVDVQYSNGEVSEKVDPMSFQKVRPMGSGAKVGGVLFLDEAYDLDPANNRAGADIFNEIMAAAEDHRDCVTIILAGYQEDIHQKLYRYNIGMPRRFIDVPFTDFDLDQLHEIFAAMLKETGWIADPGVARVAARRVARAIGSKNFGNAGDVRKLFNLALERAKQEYFSAPPGAPRIMAVEHVIGKRPTKENIPALRKALEELHAHVGLKSVKKEVEELVALVLSNYDKELRYEEIDAVPMNRLFLGNPGTGKTTIALLYGRILAALGLLSKGGVLDRKASDFKGSVVGESEKNTSAIIDFAQGKVLLIDEAYLLSDGGSGQGSFGAAVLDTIVERVQGRPGEDIAVILAGYEPQMLKMLRDQNPGLSRRFNPASSLRFDDFSDLELLGILSQECVRTNTKVSFKAKHAAIAHLGKTRALPNFGNAGAVKSMLADAKRRMASRTAGMPHQEQRLEVEDFVGKEDELKANPMATLNDLEDVGDFKARLKRLGMQIQLARREGSPIEGLLTNYIFTGKAGTGKTTVARKMAAILHAYGAIARPDVVETTGEGLTGEFVGQTKKNVEEKMNAARGGVLFVDEAYDLGKGKFGQEAMNTLLAMLTAPEFKGKTIVVLAGYGHEMHDMLARNPGMKSRFKPTGYIDFQDWEASKCLQLVKSLASKAVPSPFVLEPDSEELILNTFERLGGLPGWANARDAESLFQLLVEARGDRVADAGFAGTCELARTITRADAEAARDDFLKTRPAVEEMLPQIAEDLEAAQTDERAGVLAPISAAFAQAKTAPPTSESEADIDAEATLVSEESLHDDGAGGDGETFDKSIELVAAALQMQKVLFLSRVQQWNNAASDLGNAASQGAADQIFAELKAQVQAIADAVARTEADRLLEELKRQQAEALKRLRKAEVERRRREEEERRREEERLRQIAEVAERERQRLAAEEKRAEAVRKEQRAQQWLRQNGQCMAGYSWIHLGGGSYVCAGGSHYTTVPPGV